jgi:hypothetical protein
MDLHHDLPHLRGGRTVYTRRPKYEEFAPNYITYLARFCKRLNYAWIRTKTFPKKLFSTGDFLAVLDDFNITDPERIFKEWSKLSLSP